MSRLKKIIVAVVVLIPLGALATAYLKVQSGVDSALRQVTEVAAPYAAVRYGDRSVDWTGKVTVRNVQIQPSGSSVVLPIQSVMIDTPGLKYLATRTGSDFWSRGRPDSLRLEFTDLALELSGNGGELLDRLAALTARPEAAGISHCGDTHQINLAAWRAMGFNRLHVDGSMEYRMDSSRDTASLSANAKVKELMALSASMAMSQVQAHSGTTPWLRGHVNEMRISYKDDGYLEGLKRYCTTTANTDVAAFLDGETGPTGSLFFQQFSIAPGPTLRAAYREYLARPDTMTIDLAFPPDYKIENTGLYNAADMADSITFTVNLNGKRADDVQYGFRPPREGPSQAVLSAQAAVAAMNKPRVPTRKGESPGIVDAPKYVFRAVPKNQLNKYLGKQVRFHVTGSSVREGILTAIDGGIAHVQRTRGDNEMSLSIALRHVERVEVAQ